MGRGSLALGVALATLVGVGAADVGRRGVALAEDRKPAAPAPAAPPGPPATGAVVDEGLDFDPLPSFASRIQNALPSKRADPAKRQRAIDAALEWLAAHQAPDGGWRPHDLSWCRGVQGNTQAQGLGKAMYEVGVTGAALAAFLLVGIGPFADHPHATTVRKALEYLRARQDAEGCFGPRTAQHFIYNHAFACLAVLEAYGMTGERTLGESARRGLAFCLLCQNTGAGWRYGVKPGESDTSATIAMGACLSVAHAIDEGVLTAGGLDPLPFPDEAVHGMHAWFDRMTDLETGRLGYLARGAGSARTPEVVEAFPAELVEPLTSGVILLRRTLPPPTPVPAGLEAKSVTLVRALLPEWSTDRGTIDFLHWYYGTLALSVVGGPAWEEWDGALGAALVPAQRADGTECDVRGSWDPSDPWGPEGGRVYSTAFGVLALAGANRYRPVPRTDLLAALKTKGLAPHLQALAARATAALGLDVDEATVLALAKHASAEVRAAAAALLVRGAVKDAPVAALTALLADGTPSVRLAALRAVDGAEPWRTRLLESVVALAGDPRVDIAARALVALRHAGSVPLAPRIAALLTHADAGLQDEARRCLWRLGVDRPLLEERLALVLTRGSAAERRLTLEVLEPAEIGPGGFAEAVRTNMTGDDPVLAVAAARLLRDDPSASTAALGATVRALSAVRPEARHLALDLLATWPPGATIPMETVAPLAVDGPLALRLAAVRVLARAKEPTPHALAALTATAAHRHAPLAKAAEEALARFAVTPTDRARLYATALLGNSTYALRRGVWRGYERLGGEAVPYLVELTRNPALNDDARSELLTLLGRLGKTAKAALPEVVRLLRWPAPAVRRSAAEALGEPGLTDPGAVDYVVQGLADADPSVRDACARALVRLARREDEAAKEVDRLLDFQDEKPPRLVTVALEELRRWPDASARVARSLLRLLGHDDGGAAWGAMDALAAMRADAVKLLVPILSIAGDPRIGMACRALESIGRPAEPAVSALLSLLTTHAYESAADALGAIGKPAVSALVSALAHDDAQVRKLAARGLGKAGREASSAAGALKRALKDPDADVRKEAAAALRRVRP